MSKLARLAMEYSLDAQPNDKIGIRGFSIAEPLVTELYAAGLARGGHPNAKLLPERQQEIFFSLASDEQLAHVSPFVEYEIRNLDKIIEIQSSPNLKSLSNVDPAKMAKANAARAPLMEVFMERFGVGSYLVLPYPTSAMAQEAEMGTQEYEDFVYTACALDAEDPVDHWREVSREQDQLIKVLEERPDIRVVGEDTDITLSTEGRRWMNCDGRMNLPDGEICTSPLENSLDGEIRFTYPAIFQGREVEDISLRFEKGVVVEARAAKGEEFLKEMISVDAGAKMVGEFAIGTNNRIPRFTKDILFDEKLGGTIHMALGAALPETGGTNKSGIHWDILKDMKAGGQILGNGELIYEEGRFVI